MKKLVVMAVMLFIISAMNLSAQVAPVTRVPNVIACQASEVAIPILVSNFTDIGALSLKLDYNPAVMTYVGGDNTAGFPNLVIDGSLSGSVFIGGMVSSGLSGITLPDGSELLSLRFTYLGGSANLTWDITTAGACEYTGPPPTFDPLDDTPKSTHYLNGSLGLATNPVVSVTNSAACVGDYVTVPVTVSSFADICAISMVLQYDPAKLHFESYDNTEGLLDYFYVVPGSPLNQIFLGGNPFHASLSDGASLLNLNFTVLAGGVSPITFDNSDIAFNEFSKNVDYPPYCVPTCDAGPGIFYVDGAITVYNSPVVTASSGAACVGSQITIPATVTGFNDICSISLVLQYDPLKLQFDSWQNSAGLIDNQYIVTGSPLNSIFFGGTPSSVSLADGSSLFNMNFTVLSPGANGLSWDDSNDANCEFSQHVNYPPFCVLTCDNAPGIYYVNGTITGNALPAAPVAGDITVCFDGNTYTGSASVGSGETVVWYTAASGGLITSAPSGNTPGTYTAYAAAKVTATGCESATRTLVTVIVNALPSAPLAGSLTVCYDGVAHTATATVGSGETVVWYTALTGGTVTTAPSGSAVGIYTAYAAARITATGCESTSRTMVTLTINATVPAPPAVDVTACYDGAVHTGSATVGVGETIVWYDAAINGNVTTAPSGTAVGIYTAWAAAKVIATGCESASRTLVTVTINALPSAPAAGNVSVCFDGLAHTGTATVGVGETVVWYDAALNGNIVSAPSGTLAGTYTAYAAAKITSTSCESAIRTQVTVTIHALPSAPVAGNVTAVYDGLLHTGTATAPLGSTVNWFTASTGGSSTTAPSGTAVGTYSAWAESVNSSTACISTSRTLVTVTITPASLSITANNDTKVYNGLTYSGGNGVSYTGFVNGETSAVLGGTLSYSGTSQGAIVVGSYIITPGGLTSTNYTITYVNGSLSVTPAPLSIMALSLIKTYDALPFAGGNGVSYVGFVNLENPSVLSGTLTYGGTSQGAINVGNYTIIPGGLTSSNYSITFVNGTLLINPATLTITANSTSKHFGSTVTFSGTEFTSAGLIGTDAVSSVSLSSTGAGVAAVAGTYPIVAVNALGSGLGNYSIVYVDGVLTVYGPTLYVNDNSVAGDVYTTGPGNNVNPGTSSAPLRSINFAISVAQNGDIIKVDAGTYTENVVVYKALSLRGSNFGNSCSGSRVAECILDGGSGTAISVTSNGVTVDGFTLNAANGLTDASYTGLDVRNNIINANTTGIGLNGLTLSAGNGLSLQNNCIDNLTGAASTGIALTAITGNVAASVSNNNLSNGNYGYTVYNVNTTPKTSVNNGIVSNYNQGVLVSNTDGTAWAASNIGFDGINIVATGKYRGVTVFTSGNTPSHAITASFDNLVVSGTGNSVSDWAGMGFEDYSTNAGSGQNISITACTVSNNLNRGIHVRGANAQVVITTSTLTNNGSSPAVGQDGIGINSQRGATVAITNCFITNPSSSASSVDAMATTFGGGLGGNILAFNNSLNANGNASSRLAFNANGTNPGSFSASCNWWGSACSNSISPYILGDVVYSPWLTSGTDSDLGTVGFQATGIVCANTDPVIAGNDIVCFGSTANVYTTQAGMSNYVWLVSGGLITTPDPSNSNSISVDWIYTGGSNTVSVYYTAYGCTSPMAVKAVTVNPLPNAPSAVNYNVCFDGTTYTGSANVGVGETLVWYTASSGGSITTAPSGSAVGSYTAYAGARNTATGCESATRTLVTVTINAIPAAPAPGNVTVCFDGSVHTGTATAGIGEAIVWYNAPTGGSVTVAPSGTSAGIYTAYAAAKNTTTNCESANRTLVTVTIHALPVPTITGASTACAGTSATYTTEAGMSSYSWTVNGGTGSSTSNSITISWGSGPAGSVSVNYVDPATSCTAAVASLTNVSIFVNPTGNIAITTPITCNGGSGTVTITATAGSSPFSYTFNGISNATGIFSGIIAGTYSWSISDAHSCVSVVGSVTVTEPAALSVSGTYKYYNTNNTLLDNVRVRLVQGADTVYVTTTNASGHYTFSNVCPGTYQVMAKCSKPVQSINSTDAALVNLWGVSPYSIEKIKFYSGDVIGAGLGTVDNYINSFDAYRILLYFVYQYNVPNPPYSARGPWTFWNMGESIAANPPVSTVILYPSITVGSTNVTHDFYGMLTGDFNQSAYPTGKAMQPTVDLVSHDNYQVKPGAQVEIPVLANVPMEIGAVSLVINYPSSQLKIQQIEVNGNNEQEFLYTIEGDELRIGWYSATPVTLSAGQRLFTIKAKATTSLQPNTKLAFTLSSTVLNEIADEKYKTIANASLSIPNIIGMSTGITNSAEMQNLGLTSFPNPFNNHLTISYTVPVEGMVNIEVSNVFGEKISTLVNSTQIAGEYTFEVDPGLFKPGVYFTTIRLTNDGSITERTIKVICE